MVRYISSVINPIWGFSVRWIIHIWIQELYLNTMRYFSLGKEHVETETHDSKIYLELFKKDMSRRQTSQHIRLVLRRVDDQERHPWIMCDQMCPKVTLQGKPTL